MKHGVVKVVCTGVALGGGGVVVSGDLPRLVPVVGPQPHPQPWPSTYHLATDYHIIATAGPGTDLTTQPKFILKLELQARFPLADDEALRLSLHGVGADHLQ